ncbi:conserved hypothetical protein [Neospora caninum Liverpool]|uniref:Uncharacterized protein n=1 Tax=Neospora caninum (strain Liverpool) TaxID=572307 RepID=F0VBF5_NEOCL|nr:conserved hypothetical protein [Neospora caninum Liverpool]CBZ50939.1 conserved hypothetical protein [Neospora caninum Liverpool]|eukprot:XP_003880972.1 conserved hypothetical protein [Neospora caninum Liverpool]
MEMEVEGRRPGPAAGSPASVALPGPLPGGAEGLSASAGVWAPPPAGGADSAVRAVPSLPTAVALLSLSATLPPWRQQLLLEATAVDKTQKTFRASGGETAKRSQDDTRNAGSRGTAASRKRDATPPEDPAGGASRSKVRGEAPEEALPDASAETRTRTDREDQQDTLEAGNPIAAAHPATDWTPDGGDSRLNGESEAGEKEEPSGVTRKDAVVEMDAFRGTPGARTLDHPSLHPPQFSSHFPVLREAAKEALRRVYRRFALCIEDARESKRHIKGRSNSADVETAALQNARKAASESEVGTDPGSLSDDSKKQDAMTEASENGHQGYDQEKDRSSPSHGGDRSGLEEQNGRNDVSDQSADPVYQLREASNVSCVDAEAEKSVDGGDQKKASGEWEETKDRPMAATETCPEATQEEALHGSTKAMAAPQDRIDLARPHVALLLTSLPNIRLAPLHRMITAHYKVHDAAPMVLFLAACPSTGRCRGYGVILVQSFEVVEKLLHAPVFIWRAAGGDGRPGGCRIPRPRSSAHFWTRSMACPKCLASVASPSVKGPRSLPSTGGDRFSPVAAGEGGRRCDGSGRSSVSSPDSHAGRCVGRGPVAESPARDASGVSGRGDRRWPGRDSRRGGFTRLAAAGRERRRMPGVGGSGRGEEFERRKQPLCDRAAKLHLLVSPTLQFQCNARVSQLVTQSTWSRTFSSSVWTQLFKCILFPSLRYSPATAAAAEGDPSSTKRLYEMSQATEGSARNQKDVDQLEARRLSLADVGQPPTVSLQSESLARLGASATAVAALLQTSVYTTSKRLYLNLPHAALRALLRQDARGSSDALFSPGKRTAAPALPRDSDQESGMREKKNGDRGGRPTAFCESHEAGAPLGGPRCESEGQHALAKDPSADGEVQAGTKSEADTADSAETVDTGRSEPEGGRGVKRLREEVSFASNVLDMILRDRRPATFTMSDDDGARYSIEPLSNGTDSGYPWHVKPSGPSESSEELSETVSDALDALFRSLVEEQIYPVEYLAFEGVHVGNAWLVPPPRSPLCETAPPPHGPSADKAHQGSKPLRWGEKMETVVLPHVLLVRGLPNAAVEGAQQSLEKMLAELWGSWLLSHAGAAAPVVDETGSASCSLQLASSLGRTGGRATDVLAQELWGWQLFDFLETRMLRGDGFLLLPSCLPAATALKLLSVCSLPQTEDGSCSTLASRSPQTESSGDASASAPLSPLLLPLIFRVPSPSAPHVFSVLPFEVSSHLKSRDLPFIVSLVNSVLRHLLHRCVASTVCCCSLRNKEVSEDAEAPVKRRCCCCSSCSSGAAGPTGQEAEKASSEPRLPPEALPAAEEGDATEAGDPASEGKSTSDPAAAKSSTCEAPDDSITSSSVPATSCACCCCVEEIRDPGSEGPTGSTARSGRHRRRRRIPLGTAQVARGWVAGLPPLQVRPGLPFAMPYAPLITSARREKRGDRDENRYDEDPMFPPPACGAEHLIESLFFSVEAFFQQPFLRPFFSLRTVDECREMASAANADEPWACEDAGDSGEDGSSMTGDEEEGEMEDEEENNDVWYLQKRENRWRRVSADTLCRLANHEDRRETSIWKRRELPRSGLGRLSGDTGSDASPPSPTLPGSPNELACASPGDVDNLRNRGRSGSGGAAMDTAGERDANVMAQEPEPAVQPKGPAPDCCGGGGRTGTPNEESSGEVKAATDKSTEEREGETRLSVCAEDDKRSERMSLDSGRSGGLSSPSSPVRRDDMRDPRETGDAREKVHKKRWLVRLDTRPTLEHAHSVRVSPETLASLEAEGRFSVSSKDTRNRPRTPTRVAREAGSSPQGSVAAVKTEETAQEARQFPHEAEVEGTDENKDSALVCSTSPRPPEAVKEEAMQHEDRVLTTSDPQLSVHLSSCLFEQGGYASTRPEGAANHAAADGGVPGMCAAETEQTAEPRIESGQAS